MAHSRPESPEATSTIGDDLGEALELSREHLDMRRMLVSEGNLAGARVGDLHLHERYAAVVTRVRRGDTDHLVDERTVLQLRDRVRLVALREAIGLLTKLFGDSFATETLKSEEPGLRYATVLPSPG